MSVRISQIYRIFHSSDFQNQLWTVIPIGVVSIFPTLLIFFATRQVGVDLAGMIVLAFALSDLPITLVMFGVRGFQNVDVNQDIQFNTYFGLRTLCAIFATLGFAVYLLVVDFDTLQLIIVILIYMMSLSNAYADVFMGDLQQKGKMWVSGKMQTSCYAVALFTMLAVLLLTSSLTATLVAAAIVIISGYIWWIWRYRKHFGAIRVKFRFLEIKKLTLRVLPSITGGFIFAYLFNSPKYYLEAFFSIHDVAIYGFLLLPVALLNLVAVGFFSGAIATKTAGIWVSGDIKQFKRRVNLQLLTAAGLFVPFLVGVYCFGIPLLSWFYATDLTEFKTHMMLLSLGGMLKVPFSVIAPILIIFQLQKVAFYYAVLVAAIAGSMLWWLVSQYGLNGAAFSMLLLLVPLTIGYYAIFCIALKKHERKTERNEAVHRF